MQTFQHFVLLFHYELTFMKLTTDFRDFKESEPVG